MAGWCGELLSSPEATVRTVLAASVGSLSPSVAERASACISRLPPADGVEVICALHGAALRFAEALEAACAGAAPAEPAKLSEEQLAAIFRGFVALHKPYSQLESKGFSAECTRAAKGFAPAGSAKGAGAAVIGEQLAAGLAQVSPPISSRHFAR